MSFYRRLLFNLKYLYRPPWDTGIVPPEVVDYIATHKPGRALDLGCGTGTSSLALAKAGWTVTGVDFAPRAIRSAKRKARKAKLAIDFRVGDVSRLPAFTSPFDLVLDIGCFHGLPPSGKTDYLNQLDRLLAPSGEWLLYSFFNFEDAPGPGLTVHELESITKQLKLLQRIDGNERNIHFSAWFLFRKV